MYVWSALSKHLVTRCIFISNTQITSSTKVVTTTTTYMQTTKTTQSSKVLMFQKTKKTKNSPVQLKQVKIGWKKKEKIINFGATSQVEQNERRQWYQYTKHSAVKRTVIPNKTKWKMFREPKTVLCFAGWLAGWLLAAAASKGSNSILWSKLDS